MSAHPEGWTCHHPTCQPRPHWAVRALVFVVAFAMTYSAVSR